MSLRIGTDKRRTIQNSAANVAEIDGCLFVERSLNQRFFLRQNDQISYVGLYVRSLEMSYINPETVLSPKKNWQLVEVILDKGAGNPAYAIGLWDHQRRIGFRWNGTDNNPLGNPQSRGLATWTMLDEKLHSAVIALISPDKQKLVSSFLNVAENVELKVDYHPSGRRTLKEKLAGQSMYKDLRGPLFANTDKAQFYRAVANEIAERQAAGQHVTFKDTALD